MIKPKILFIHPEGNWANNPTLNSIIELLLDKKYKITYLSDNRFKNRDTKYRALTLKTTPRLVNSFSYYALIRFSSTILSFLTACLYKALFIRENFTYIIAVDREGLIVSYFLSKLINSPYCYISFEIFFESETSAKFKRLERVASRDVTFWVAQDSSRSKILIRENNLDPDKVILIPVSSAGRACIKETSKKTRRHTLPTNKKYCIFIGSTENWTMFDEIIKGIELWPVDWALFIHSRYGLSGDRIKQIPSHLINSKLFISNVPEIPFHELDQLFSQMSFGLAFYKPDYSNRYLGDNIKYLGKSSGKIATYLKHGLPVITNEIGLMAREIKKYKLGCVVGTPAEIGPLLETKKMIKHFDSNCVSYFNDHLDFNIYCDKFISKLEEV